MASSNTTPSEQTLNLRKILEQTETNLVSKLGPPPPAVSESYLNISLPDGHTLKAKTWTPTTTSPSHSHPLIVLFHGGGFQCGSPEMCTLPGRAFSQTFKAVVIAPAYRLAPEHKFPRPTLDGIETLRWLARNATSLGADISKGFIVGGYSAGGNIAAAITHQLKNELPITGSFLSIPHLLHPSSIPEKYKALYQSRLANDHLNPRFHFLETFLLQDFEADISSPLFSPINSTSLQNLPRTFIQTGSKDLLRDDGTIYSKHLEEAGVETKLYCQEDVDHQGFTIWFDEEEGSPRGLRTETMKGIAWLLRREWEEE